MPDDPASRGKGVLVVLNDEINSAREVTKTDAHRLQTFQSRDYGFLGVVHADRVVYYRDVMKRHTGKSEFDVSHLEELPRVDVVMTYQGATGDIIKAVVDQGARVLSSPRRAPARERHPGGRYPYAMDKGVFVVTTTRTGGGRIAATPSARVRRHHGPMPTPLLSNLHQAARRPQPHRR